MTHDAKATKELLATVDEWIAKRDRLREHLEAEVERLTTELTAARRALVILGGGAAPTRMAARDQDSRTAQILRFVADHPGASSNEIRKATGDGTMCSVLATRPIPRLRRENIDGLWRYYLIEDGLDSPQAIPKDEGK